MFDQNQLIAWCSLIRASGVGSKTFSLILDSGLSPVDFFDLPENCIRERLPNFDLAKIKQWRSSFGLGKIDCAWQKKSSNHHIITISDSRYPDLLKSIDDPPPILFVIGNVDLLSDPQLAIVGSRNASNSALNDSFSFAKFLNQKGLVITSGLAHGIDGYAHKGALAGNGLTIAVTGTGLDRVYPAQHLDLAHKIAEKGAIVSEFPIGVGVRSSNFPRRNRIISGLSLGVLVVESSLKSGSLITARMAIEQGREVFAIPGSIHNPLAKGCHHLIKEGAKLTESADDIFIELKNYLDQALIRENKLDNSVYVDNQSNLLDQLDEKSVKLLQAIDFSPTSIDDIANRTNFTDSEISSLLTLLELDGWVESLAGQTFQRLGR